jgi:hypothetical protein
MRPQVSGPVLARAETGARAPESCGGTARSDMVFVERPVRRHCCNTRAAGTAVFVTLLSCVAAIMTALGWIYGFAEGFGAEDGCIAPVKVWAQVRSGASAGRVKGG